MFLFKKAKAVKVYKGTWWKGDYLSLGEGMFDWAYLQPKGYDDRIKSIYIPFGYKAKMCSNPHLEGHCKVFSHSSAWVKVGDGVSSIKVFKWW